MHLRTENTCPGCQGPRFLLCFSCWICRGVFQSFCRSKTTTVTLDAWGRTCLCLVFGTIQFSVNHLLWSGQRNRILPNELPVGHQGAAQWWSPSLAHEICQQNESIQESIELCLHISAGGTAGNAAGGLLLSCFWISNSLWSREPGYRISLDILSRILGHQ